MPNWAAGNIRFRGKRENILKFLGNELIYVVDHRSDPTYEDGECTAVKSETELRHVKIEENRGGWSIIIHKEPYGVIKKSKTEADLINDNFYFRNSDRQFILSDQADLELFFSEGPNQNKDQIMFIDEFNAAWNVDTAIFRKYAATYKIDIRIFVWESGLCWSQMLTFYRDGKSDSELKFFHDWQWDSPMPMYGG